MAPEPLQKISTVIWDYNGTLLDDTGLCITIVNRLLRERGLPVLTSDQYRNIFDFPVKDYYRRLGFDFSTESYEDLAADFIGEYEHRRTECDLHQHARETLAACASHGIRHMVLSAYAQESLVQMIEHHGLTTYFDALYGLDNHLAGGKEALGRRLIAGESITPQTTVLIGDTTHDYAVAQAMGIDCLLFCSGHQSRQRLQTCGTNVVIFSTLNDILKHIINRQESSPCS